MTCTVSSAQLALIDTILVRVPAAVTNPNLNQLGEDKVDSLYASTLQFITKKSQDWNSSWAGNWRKKLVQKQ